MDKWIEKLIAYHRIGRIDTHTALRYLRAVEAELYKGDGE